MGIAHKNAITINKHLLFTMNTNNLKHTNIKGDFCEKCVFSKSECSKEGTQNNSI